MLGLVVGFKVSLFIVFFLFVSWVMLGCLGLSWVYLVSVGLWWFSLWSLCDFVVGCSASSLAFLFFFCFYQGVCGHFLFWCLSVCGVWVPVAHHVKEVGFKGRGGGGGEGFFEESQMFFFRNETRQLNHTTQTINLSSNGDEGLCGFALLELPPAMRLAPTPRLSFQGSEPPPSLLSPAQYTTPFLSCVLLPFSIPASHFFTRTSFQHSSSRILNSIVLPFSFPYFPCSIIRWSTHSNVALATPMFLCSPNSLSYFPPHAPLPLPTVFHNPLPPPSSFLELASLPPSPSPVPLPLLLPPLPLLHIPLRSFLKRWL